MNTVGYVLILFALLLLRGLTRGRGISDLPKDAADAFIAVIRNDQTALREVANRTGDSLGTATPIDPLAAPESGGAAKGSTDGLTANTAAGRAAIASAYPGLTIGGVRKGPDAQDHAIGKALDVMTSNGEPIAAFAQKLPNVQYVIWNQRIWNVSRAKEGWRVMGDRGSNTANHKDHVHVSFK